MIDITALALLGFAGYRATQLAVHDTLLDPVRDRVHAWADRAPDSGPRKLVIDLISCVYCMGWWISGALLAVYLFVTGEFHHAPLLLHGVEWLAVAGLAVLFNRVDDALGAG
ncbi:DUF1360 domain-containing protein [Streptomyces anulatus]|uniref:DUF1360 domain-containing protein n=1 Tax=Streptomyces anulatus TaxID=1892 RepID=UPI003690E028